MKYLMSFFLASTFIMLFNPAFGEDFPKGPPNLKEVKAKGYPQLSTEELKTFFHGEVVAKNPEGNKVVSTFNADGTLKTKSNKGFEREMAYR